MARQAHLSSLSTGIMCCEMTWGIECNVEKARGFRNSPIGLLFNKVPFDRSRLHLYPFVIATIDWWLVAEAMEPWATSVPANKWANLLQRQEGGVSRKGRKGKKRKLFCSLHYPRLRSPQVFWLFFFSDHRGASTCFITTSDVQLLGSKRQNLKDLSGSQWKGAN